MSEIAKPYPGDAATAEQLIQLAGRYREAAALLCEEMEGRKDLLSRAPFRLVAIHAVELYLNALLRHTGSTHADIRAMQHKFAKRTELPAVQALTLRKRTMKHLAALDTNREYVVARYGPEMALNVSQITRLNATLDDIAKKVTMMVTGQPVSPVPRLPASASGARSPKTSAAAHATA